MSKLFAVVIVIDDVVVVVHTHTHTRTPQTCIRKEVPLLPEKGNYPIAAHLDFTVSSFIRK